MGFLKKIFNPFASDNKEEITGVPNVLPKQKDGTIPNKGEAVLNSETAKAVISRESGSIASSISDIGILEESVRDLILNSVAPFTGSDDFGGISLWVNDQLYHIINRDKFINTLKAAFDSMGLFSLGSGTIKIIHGVPTPQDEASPLFNKDIHKDTIWIRLFENGKLQVKQTKAVITVLKGHGSCKEKKYILCKDDKDIYHIGRGAISNKPGSAYRVNDIIVEENNPDPAIQKMNNFVSSAQADIILDDGHFYLKAMPTGCRSSGGSATKIIRDQKPMELRDSNINHPLQDGDIIELGKSVLLYFSIVE
jgi:hypothetical protein